MVWQGLPWERLAVHYSEIALKGANRRAFVDALQRRLEARTGRPFRVLWDRLETEVNAEEAGRLGPEIARIFGVARVFPLLALPREPGPMAARLLLLLGAALREGRTFAVRVTKVDPEYPLGKRELERELGRLLQQETRAPVNLETPDLLLQIRLYPEAVFLAGPGWSGPGGLPVGTSGRMLCLFSGGIDSPVAAWLMMRRGAEVDFLHVHSFPDAAPVRETKIPRLVVTLCAPQAVRARLFLVPYFPFQVAFLRSGVDGRLELVLFRRFLVRLAQAVAEKEGYGALITGDNLGQVASQTLENLRAVDAVARLPVFRPLIGLNKTEIIQRAKEIGTYKLSIQKYKDCCSLILRHPRTRPPLATVERAEDRLAWKTALEECLRRLETWELPEAAIVNAGTPGNIENGGEYNVQEA